MLNNINMNDLETLREVYDRMKLAHDILVSDMSDYNDSVKVLSSNLYRAERLILEEIERLEEVIRKEILMPGASELDRIVAGWVRESQAA